MSLTTAPYPFSLAPDEPAPEYTLIGKDIHKLLLGAGPFNDAIGHIFGKTEPNADRLPICKGAVMGSTDAVVSQSIFTVLTPLIVFVKIVVVDDDPTVDIYLFEELVCKVIVPGTRVLTNVEAVFTAVDHTHPPDPFAVGICPLVPDALLLSSNPLHLILPDVIKFPDKSKLINILPLLSHS